MFDNLIERTSERMTALQDEIKKLNEQANQLACIRKDWPSAVPEPTFCVAQHDEWWFRMDVATENEANVIMERMNPVNLYMVWDRWQRFTPEFRLDTGRYPLVQSKTDTPHSRHLSLPYYYEIAQLNREHSLIFFVLINTQPARIEVRIAERSGDKYMTARSKDWKGGVRYYDAQLHDKSGEFNKVWVAPRGSEDAMPTGYLYREG